MDQALQGKCLGGGQGNFPEGPGEFPWGARGISLEAQGNSPGGPGGDACGTRSRHLCPLGRTSLGYFVFRRLATTGVLTVVAGIVAYAYIPVPSRSHDAPRARPNSMVLILRREALNLLIPADLYLYLCAAAATLFQTFGPCARLMLVYC